MHSVEFNSHSVATRFVRAQVGRILVGLFLCGLFCIVPVAGSPQGQQKTRQQAPEKAAREPVDTSGLEIRDDGRNEGEPENANPRSKTGPFRFFAEVYARYKDKDEKETDEEDHRAGIITTVATQVEANLFDGEHSELKGEFRFRRNFDARTESADWSDFDLTLGYKSRGHRLEATVFSSPNMLAFFREDEAILKDITGIEFGYQRRLNRRFQFRSRYEFAREIFSDVKERDVARNRFRAELRYQLHRYFHPGVGFQMETRRGKSDNFSRDELSPVFLLSSRFKDRAVVSLTYRYHFRENVTPDASQSNFGREDRGSRLSVRSFLRLHGSLWLRLFTTFQEIDSTKMGRDLARREIGIGLRYYSP